MGGCSAREAVHVRPVVFNPSSIDLPDSIEQRNLELYHLFWLDTTVRAPENIETQGELRAIINYLKIFERNNQCVQEFGNIAKGKIFLLLASSQSHSLLPMIHDHKQLHSIYIYRNGPTKDIEQLAKQYKKIKDVYDSFVVAKRYLEDDIEMHTDFDEPMVMDLLATKDDTNYQNKFTLFLKAVYTHTNGIYDLEVRHRLIDTCTPYYQGNLKETEFLKDFYRTYKPEEAISWYMRDCCLHRILARAFIERDISLLANMYSFIVDINRNIQQKSVKVSSILRVYRGQFLSKDQLNQLQINRQQIVTMQCFFSAQTSREETSRLLNTIEPIGNHNQRILFEIDISQDYTIINADLTSTSNIVLFKLGARFRIVEVTDTTVVLSQYISSLTVNEELAHESPVAIRGILTYLKDGTNEAIKYYEDILRKSSTIDLITEASIYGQLAYLKQETGNLGGATKMYEQAMTTGRKPLELHLFYLEQAAQYHSSVVNDWEKAKILWLEKLDIQNALLLKEEKAQTYENLATAAMKTAQAAQAAEYTSSAIALLPTDHPRLQILQQQFESLAKTSPAKTTS